MKKIIIILSLLLFSSVYGQNHCFKKHIPITVYQKLIDGNYLFLLDFEDHFNGNHLDTEKWTPINGIARDADFIHSKQYYRPENIEVKNGFLHLKVEHSQLINQKYDIWINDRGMVEFIHDFEYTSAEIHSKKQFHYGIYEIRCKLPVIKDLFPAFWMFSGPYWNEIDVFEFKNQNLWGIKRPRFSSKQMIMNVFYNFERDNEVYSCKDEKNTHGDLEEFHTYTLVFTPYEMYWLFDGKYMRKISYLKNEKGELVTGNQIEVGEKYYLNKSYPKPLMNIIANMAVQTHHIKSGNTLNLPANYEIDYIRYYKLYNNKVKDLPIRPIEYGLDDVFQPISENISENNEKKSEKLVVNLLKHKNIQLVLDLTREKFYNITITDKGQNIIFEEKKVKTFIYNVNIEDFKPGDYLIQIKNGKDEIVNRIDFKL